MRRLLDMQMLSRTVVVQTAFLGDALLTLPLLRAVKNDIPEGYLAVVATPEIADVFKRERCVDEVILFDKRGNAKDAFGTVCAELRKREFSCALLPHRSFRSAYMVYRAEIKTRVGFDISPAAWLYTHRATYHYSMPEAQRDLSLLSVFNNKTDKENAWFSRSELKHIQTHEVRIVIAPGSQWKTKMWDKERYGEVVRYCAGMGWHVDLCGGASDAALCESIAVQAGSPLVEDHSGKTQIPELMDIIGRAAAVVCNDSAPIHIANELGTPVVAIFGPTVPEFGFAPRGVYDQIVQAEGLLCRPCCIHGGEQCPIRTHACMNEISSDAVIEALRHVVNLQMENASDIT